MTGKHARTDIGRTSNNERPLSWEHVEERVISGNQDLVAENTMPVILLGAIFMSSIWRDGVDGQFTLKVVDDIRRVVDVSNTWSGCSSQEGWTGSRCRTSLRSVRRRLTRRRRCGARGFSRVGEVEAFRIIVINISRFAGQAEGRVNSWERLVHFRSK